jgi:hypothetical protein
MLTLTYIFALTGAIRTNRGGNVRRILLCLFLLSALGLTAAWPPACEAQPPLRKSEEPPFKLLKAFMCEAVSEGIPHGQGIAFSVSRGSICCYTLIDGIKEDSVIYHHWLCHDKSTAKFKLSLKKPRWATFSSIQLRDDDKGPWRVEITNADGRLLRTLRFSVVD